MNCNCKHKENAMKKGYNSMVKSMGAKGNKMGGGMMGGGKMPMKPMKKGKKK